MPRVSFADVRRASHNTLLAPLLHATKSLEQAQRELRWIQQELPRAEWKRAVLRRSRHEPLQYILGSQPFGELDIKCERGVLIPRWETEEWTMRLAEVLGEKAQKLRVLDACTGTGCVPLLLKHMVPLAHVEAFDVSSEAVSLARRNNHGNIISVHQADVFDAEVMQTVFGGSTFDVITSNPPYVPMADYHRAPLASGVEKSVRDYEPALALIGGTEFYKALVHNVVVPAAAKAFVFELGYRDQVDATKDSLPHGWTCRDYYDSAGKLRCVIGWNGLPLEGLL